MKKNINIELGVAQDLEKMLDNSNKILRVSDEAWKDYQDYLTRADIPFRKMIQSYNVLSNLYSSIGSLITKANSASKDLGIDPNTLKGYKALKANENTAKEILSTIASFKDPSTFQ